MVLTLCFDAISRNVNGLGYSPFMMFSMTSVTKFPASLVILLLQDRVGRKAMASGSLLISGVFTIASGFVIAFVGAKSGNSEQRFTQQTDRTLPYPVHCVCDRNGNV
jgi:MFS family permease